MNDSEIITLLNNRDEAALSAIEARFGGMCRGIASNILSDRRDVEECVSSVYFKLWNRIPPAEPKDLTAYTAKAARNEALSRYRANAAGRAMNASVSLEELENCLSGSENAEEPLKAKELARAAEEFIRRLPREQRVVFMRRVWFFDSAKAIAELLGITEKRVNALLAKTRKQLRHHLIKEEFINE
ncbi:MAG: sigma-70 family RNA polymerase sigma factor [Clostridia bacterium]|nr:sigma-70 family RNA polymerase sigma factor [Clostridia bacterium]